jgi:hypothetical protein
MKPSPGDIVIFTESLGDSGDYRGPIRVTRGSTGVVLSFDEYFGEIVSNDRNKYFARLREYTETHDVFPVRLLTAAPPGETVQLWEVNCVVGGADLFSSRYFRVIERKKGTE